ncbi:MAG TPA: hypothetical protein VMJ94_07760 [Nitrososphaera sp.]|nr:hypothetical protein [Nitrososphaera sp.]
MPKPTRSTKKPQGGQSERFKEAAREHGCEDAPDIDEVMRRLAAQKRHQEKPPAVSRAMPKTKKTDQ